jgi:D-aspartate ligase
VPIRPQVLYRIIPGFLLRRYVKAANDPEVRKRLKQVRRVAHPLRYGRDRSLRRDAWVWLSELNQVRKFRRFYPASEARATAYRGAGAPTTTGAPRG